MTMTGLPLAVVFFLFFFLFLIHFQQPIHIGLCRQKFPHFLTGTPVLGVGFLLFLQQFGILRLQVFDLGQLLHSHLIKGIFCRLMEQNFLLMFLPKFSGITGLRQPNPQVRAGGCLANAAFLVGDGDDLRVQ